MIAKIKNSKDYALYDPITQTEKEKIYGKDLKDGGKISFFLASLLHARGIEKKEEVEKFLYPKWEDLADPFLFNDMKKAVQRILKAILKNERILIYSDYDTDGIPGGALLNDFFEKISYKNFANFIPHRNKDGYGLTAENAQKIAKGKIFDNFSRRELFGDSKRSQNFLPDLVITIDCGISDTAGADILKKAKIDLIITDHHISGDKLPKALAVINHKVPKENYPDKNLCGAGVVFRLVQSIFLTVKDIDKNKSFKKKEQTEIKSIFKDIPQGWEKWLLDLVSISTVCDMVPLVGENRVLVKYGQKVLAKTPRSGLNQIIKKARLNKSKISADDLGFMIGPRINASSRIDDPFLSFRALATKGEEGRIYADDLEKINNRRKYLMSKIMKEAWKKLANEELSKKDVIVIGSRDWPLGVVGLVAGKVADKYKKPAFVWGGFEGNSNDDNTKDTESLLKGSCRSGGEYSVYDLMARAKKEFKGYGGHEMAGGFELEFKKLHTLSEKLSKLLKKTKKIEKKLKIIDAKISLSDVKFSNYQEIEKLEPFGMANQKPLFFLEDIEIKKVRKFGKAQEHLELSFKDEKSFWVNAMTFFYKDNFSEEVAERGFEVGQRVDMVVSFELNQYNGNNSLRLKIENIL